MKQIFSVRRLITLAMLWGTLPFASCNEQLKCVDDVGLYLPNTDKIISINSIQTEVYWDTLKENNESKNVFKYEFENCIGKMTVYQYSMSERLEKKFFYSENHKIDTLNSMYFPNDPVADLSYKKIFFRKPILLDSIKY